MCRWETATEDQTFGGGDGGGGDGFCGGGGMQFRAWLRMLERGSVVLSVIIVIAPLPSPARRADEPESDAPVTAPPLHFAQARGLDGNVVANAWMRNRARKGRSGREDQSGLSCPSRPALFPAP
jgi:hypothetical protein